MDETDKRFEKEFFEGTPRAMRAKRFADSVLNLMRDFLPPGRDLYRGAYKHLARSAFRANAEIISVPPECDELDKLQLERRMLDIKLKMIVPSGMLGN